MEAHSVWTFDSLPCLLQLCAAGHTYVVDLLALHDHMHLLQPVFESLGTLKLFHGGGGDIQWLQQLGLYAVNVLDTCELAQEAVKMNKLTKPGLGQVLKELCGVDTDKALASSDWRRRPLTASQLFYSILDVTYLQYIAASLVDLLLDTPAAAADAAPNGSTTTAPAPADGDTTPADPANGLEMGDTGAVVADSDKDDAGGDARVGGEPAASGEGGGEVSVGESGGENGDGTRAAGDVCAVEGGDGQGAGGEATDGATVAGARLAVAWKRSQKLALTLYKPVSCAQVAQVAAIRIATKEEAQERAACKRRKEPFQDDRCMVRAVAVACWWRSCVGRTVSVSPFIVLPDRLVTYLAYKRPKTSWGVWACLRRWSRRHREKHADRLREADLLQTGEVLEKNPLAWYLDRWEPGTVTALACPWLSSLLNRAYNLQASLPIEVERIEAAYQSRQANNGSRGRQPRSQTPSAPKPKLSPAARKERAEQTAAAARARIIQKFSKKRPAYSNCRMLAQDGSQLAACDLKKICWYVEKGLAEWVPDHGKDSAQPTIQLNFQHKTADQLRGVDAGFYYEVKRNQCVGCGESGHYLKYRIVPDCYRKNFPVQLKSHRSHDIVLLCIDCHDIAHTAAERLKRRIASSYNVPVQPSHSPPDLRPAATAAASSPSPEPSSAAAPPAASSSDTAAVDSTAAAQGGAEAAEAGVDGADVLAASEGGDVEEGDGAALAAENVPGPLYIRKAALTLERQTHLPEGKRREFEGDIIRFVYGRHPNDGETLQPGDLEAALLAGLGKLKRNQAARQMVTAGRPCPTGYTVGEVEGRMTVTAAPPEQGGHLWHGRRVVELIVAAHGNSGLQALVVAFRQAFLDAVQPQALPSTWNVHHDAPREFGSHSIFQASLTGMDTACSHGGDV